MISGLTNQSTGQHQIIGEAISAMGICRRIGHGTDEAESTTRTRPTRPRCRLQVVSRRTDADRGTIEPGGNEADAQALMRMITVFHAGEDNLAGYLDEVKGGRITRAAEHR